MHHSDRSMPTDRVIFEGDHDIAYLYRSGFVDTDRFKLETWLQAFRPSRQKDGTYSLTYDEWIDKAQYRYAGKVQPPFDISSMREGEWNEADCKQFIKEKVIPETTITYEQFLAGMEAGKKQGTIKDGILVMTAEKKRTLESMVNKYPSPRRQRALAVEKIRQHEEFEAKRPRVTQTATVNTAAMRQQQTSQYESKPDERKETAGKLSDLLSGSKK